MARTLKHLAARLERAANNVGKEGNRIKKKAAKVVARDLITVTPVDESVALSNWLATNGSPSNKTIAAHSSGVAGSTRGASVSTAIAAAMAVIDKAKPGVPIFLTNNLPYIRPLNDGHSKQQPAGFVERAKLLGGKTVREAKVKV